MTVESLEIRPLLTAAGFIVRGANRADCAHCQGGSRGTVSYTSEVAFCHRCKWTANILTLARELGVARCNSEAMSAIREDARRRAKFLGEIQRFGAWRDASIRNMSDRYRYLSQTAITAAEVLTKFPECDAAWDALARLYHVEGKLSGILEWLMFTKASEWLVSDSLPAEVFDAWRLHA